MGNWLIHRDELTSEQLRAIELAPSEHRVIFGAPGSGKTQVLLHRARHLMDTWKVPPDRFRIFVFNNVLKKYIHSGLHLLDLPDNCVMTFDKWCRDYYRSHIPGPLPMNDGQPDYAEIRRRVLQELRLNLFPLQYDFVLVDEGQDLDGTSFEIMRRIARHVTVCIDHKQQIYEDGSTETDILARLELRYRNVSLLDAFRCCPFIVTLSAEFINNPEERESYKRQSRTFQQEMEAPLLYIAPDFKEDERPRLIEILRIRQLRQETIAILLPTKRKVYGFATAIREAGVEIETPEHMDFTNNTPKIMTYFGAKGLTFDTILMPRLVKSSFIGIDESRLTRLLFVGIARATKWVYLSTCQRQEIPLLERLKPLEEENLLTIQTGHQVGQDFPDSNQEPPETGGILDLL